MILFYSPKVNNRVQYTVRTIIKDICGFDYKVTSSTEEFLNFKGAKINYSDREFPGESLNIYPHGFLWQKGVVDFTPLIDTDFDTPHLFPLKNKEKKCDLGFDMFAAAFYLLSRYEEYLPFLEDRHGRFEADQSFTYQNGLLEYPLVDIYAMQLKQKLIKMFSLSEETKNRRFTFIPTYDIDVAYAFKGKGVARNLFLFTRDVLTLNFRQLAKRIRILNNKEHDPFDTYAFQLELQKKYGLNPIYFFLSGHFGPKDRNISTQSKAFHVLAKTIGDYAQTGIHPSYSSNHKTDRLEEEINLLSSILKRIIINSRQHYLKIKMPQTYQNLLKANIKNDFSMGYASHIGFRAGTCSPFNFYDISLEAETRLRIYPTAIMDSTIKDYMKLNPDNAVEKATKLIDTIKQVEGTFVSLWHNDSLSDKGQWAGWQKVYIDIVRYASSLEKKQLRQSIA